MGPGRTEDGFGMALGVNHLGHFLLTNLLLEKLQQCGPSRVVTVAALLHCFGTANFPLLASKKDSVSGQSTWNNFRAYCNSKLFNVLFTRELANRLEGTSVTCYSLHPGKCPVVGALKQTERQKIPLATPCDPLLISKNSSPQLLPALFKTPPVLRVTPLSL